MKQISIYILAIVFLSATLIGLSYNVKIPDGAREMQIYSKAQPPIEHCDGVDTMTNFNIYHYSCEVVGIKDKKLDNTLGVAYIYPKDKTSVAILLDRFSVDVVFSQELDCGVTYYGRSRVGQKSVNIDNEKINIQIVSNKDNIIVGFPLIMGSY